jgi:hypothetical protein
MSQDEKENCSSRDPHTPMFPESAGHLLEGSLDG